VQSPSPPIIVRVVENERSEISGLADVLIGSIGLTGLIMVIAAALGIVLAAIIIGYRKLQERPSSSAISRP
jgi:ABC-type phosphate transport system permease subunit